MPNRLAQELASADKLRARDINTLPGRTSSQLMSVDQFHRSIPWYEHLLGGLTGQDVTLGRGPNDPMRAEVPFSPGDLKALMRAFQMKPARTHPTYVASKKWYHGTGADDLTLEALNPFQTKSSENLFGPGIYLTDDSGVIPQGYANARTRSIVDRAANKRRDPQIYEARVQPKKVLDLEEPAPKNVIDIFEEISQSLYDGPDMIDGELKAVLDHGLTHDLTKADRFTTIRHKVPPKVSTEELYDALKADMHIHGEFLDYEADELFFNIAEGLRKAGYDALTHTGGHRTGNRAHQVLIMLDPNNDYGMRTMSSLERRLPGGEVSSFETVKPPRFGRTKWPMFQKGRKR